MLDNKHCEAFFAVAENGSFEQAGVKLYITASAVTLRVQALEKELGQLLLIRGRPCVLTQAGQQLFEHLQHIRRLEQNLLHGLTGSAESNFFKTVIGSNEDSLATWLLPALKEVLLKEKIVIELRTDDQSHTYSLLERGTVSACISIEDKPMRGCNAEYLGVMRYRMVSTKHFRKKWFAEGVHRENLRMTPAIIFNEKDRMHFDILEKRYGLMKGTYPCHLIPSSESFVTAIKFGLGYGMVPELQLNAENKEDGLEELLPEAKIEIPLYWHHWTQQSKPLQLLTEHIVNHTRLILA
ncbi:ArgP/LysG family DNA-binding transcriptional regulator [Acinetobacter sp. TUM15131]|uniref:ArgP/LysG family DNA-binding transcriptional regulator n=1 Tax=Acinetobacter sp. TUM15131 TaxID=2609141 RepID=UPI00124EC9BF|nr:ArgP/LysG family DNA-binding transcriptional regulator [Acinetobacter sp. TUM15131]